METNRTSSSASNSRMARWRAAFLDTTEAAAKAVKNKKKFIEMMIKKMLLHQLLEEMNQVIRDLISILMGCLLLM